MSKKKQKVEPEITVLYPRLHTIIIYLACGKRPPPALISTKINNVTHLSIQEWQAPIDLQFSMGIPG